MICIDDPSHLQLNFTIISEYYLCYCKNINSPIIPSLTRCLCMLLNIPQSDINWSSVRYLQRKIHAKVSFTVNILL